MLEVRLRNNGKFSLYRTSDNAGDSGPVWMTYDYEKCKEVKEYAWVEDGAGLIRLGCGIRVGALSARSYSYQDWWQCGPVSEIIEVKYDEESKEPVWVKFKTTNSTYIAKSI